MTDDITIWAFAQVYDADKKSVYNEIQRGKSRFGWSSGDHHNLSEHPHEAENSKQLFLTLIKKGDWIVHVNSPEWGKCVAVEATGAYHFDEGIDFSGGGKDFRHYIPVDISTITEFNRRDTYGNINLSPRSRYHRVYAKENFLKFIKIVQEGGNPNSYNPFYEKTNQYLKEITKLISEYYRSKNLESFLEQVFWKVPGVSNVENKGSGWGTDHGTDLLIEYSYLGELAASAAPPIKMVVQVKSYKGTHNDAKAIDDTIKGMDFYDANLGLIVTTAENAEPLEKELERRKGKASDESQYANIEIISDADVAKLVIDVAPELIFDPDK